MRFKMWLLAMSIAAAFTAWMVARSAAGLAAWPADAPRRLGTILLLHTLAWRVALWAWARCRAAAAQSPTTGTWITKAPRRGVWMGLGIAAFTTLTASRISPSPSKTVEGVLYHFVMFLPIALFLGLITAHSSAQSMDKAFPPDRRGEPAG